jgi:hypothetical protein
MHLLEVIFNQLLALSMFLFKNYFAIIFGLCFGLLLDAPFGSK